MKPIMILRESRRFCARNYEFSVQEFESLRTRHSSTGPFGARLRFDPAPNCARMPGRTTAVFPPPKVIRNILDDCSAFGFMSHQQRRYRSALSFPDPLTSLTANRGASCCGRTALGSVRGRPSGSSIICAVSSHGIHINRAACTQSVKGSAASNERPSASKEGIARRLIDICSQSPFGECR